MITSAASEGLVLGIDVGYSPDRPTTCFCTLAWDKHGAQFRFRLTTSSPSQRQAALEALVHGRRVASVAIDGPLVHGLRHVNHYRAAEAILSRGVMQHRGKPGPTNGPVGQELHAHASVLARLVINTAQVDPATHRDPLVPERVVEAFPNIYLGALVDEGDLPKLDRDASDAFWRCLVTESSKLAGHMETLLPGRRLNITPAAITDHDERAGVVCALTALSVALNRHVAVGDPQNGDIMLPAAAEWGTSRTAPGPWLEPVLQANVASVRLGSPTFAAVPDARVVGMQ